MKLWGKPLPMLIGIAGAVAASWGIYHLVLIGSCSTPPSDGLPPCPPGSERYFFAVFLGLFTAIPMVAFGGGAPVFLSIFVGIAVAGINAARTEAGPDWLYFFGACFLVGPAIAAVTVVLGIAKQRKGLALVETGIEAIGTVLSVRDTGVTVNMNPRLELTFRIEPVGGFPAPYDATKTATVARYAIPRVGDRYPVWIDRADPSTWAFASSVDATASAGARRLWDLAKRGAAPAAPQPLTGAVPANDAVLAELASINDARARGVIGDREYASRTALLVAQLTSQPAPTPPPLA